MKRYDIKSGNFGEYNTIILENNETGEKAEIALQGATLLSFFIPLKDTLYNIIDGFASPDEFKAAKGARCWIMTPFANRVKNGSYTFNGKTYLLKPIPPRDRVIHGFTSYHNFVPAESIVDEDFCTIVLKTTISPQQYQGFPFSFNISVEYTLSGGELKISVSAMNTGSEPAPFFCGWHPYFKTNDEGIEHLLLTINADSVILVDNEAIPLPGSAAVSPVTKHPNLNYNSVLPESERVINGRTLDHCYAGIRSNADNYAASSLFDPENGVTVQMFQYGGYTLAFSGDTLANRPRKSVALEPMQFTTDAFNRPEFNDAVSVAPGETSSFTFGVKVSVK